MAQVRRSMRAEGVKVSKDIRDGREGNRQKDAE